MGNCTEQSLAAMILALQVIMEKLHFTQIPPQNCALKILKNSIIYLFIYF